MTDRREHPATVAQKKRLTQEGLKYAKNITKSEASDLIGSTVAANSQQIEILKFFKVVGASKMSQTNANRRIQEIFKTLENKKRWDTKIMPQINTRKQPMNFSILKFLPV